MYEIKIFSFGQVIESKIFKKEEYSKAQKYYKSFQNCPESYAPVLYVDGEKVDVFTAEKILDCNYKSPYFSKVNL